MCIIAVYNNLGLVEVKNCWQKLEEDTQLKDEKILLIGDFNARVGLEMDVERQIWEAMSFEGSHKRRSKDKTLNAEGKKLVEWCDKNSLLVLNGRMKSDSSGDYTFIGTQGTTVIDFAFTTFSLMEYVSDFEVGEKTESDHQPIILTMKSMVNNRKGKEGGTNTIGNFRWNENYVQEYRVKAEKAVESINMEESVTKMVECFVQKLKESGEKMKKKKTCYKKRNYVKKRRERNRTE